jgi:ABC-2 type transport system permease protein
MRLWSPEIEGDVPYTTFLAIIASSVSGTLASVMLTVGIIHEKSQHVYELFLIRPIKRRDIILSKFLAVYTCVAVAAIITVGIGLLIDYLKMDDLLPMLIENAWESLTVSLAMTAISSAAGVLIGVASPSVLVGAILVIYGGNQVSGLTMLPLFLLDQPIHSALTLAWGALLSGLLLAGAVLLFERKQF